MLDRVVFEHVDVDEPDLIVLERGLGCRDEVGVPGGALAGRQPGVEGDREVDKAQVVGGLRALHARQRQRLARNRVAAPR